MQLLHPCRCSAGAERMCVCVSCVYRGFAGELAAAAALDSLVNEGNVVLIDIRTSKEKEGSGIPDLPSAANGKSLEVEYAITEDKRLRGQLRDPAAIEAQITALQVGTALSRAHLQGA